MRANQYNEHEFQQILDDLLQGSEAALVWLYNSAQLLSPEEKSAINEAVAAKLADNPENPYYLLLQGHLFRLALDYNQAAVYYRPAMALKNKSAFYSMALMIHYGLYTPIPADFTDAGIENPRGDQYQQAAAFYRPAMALKVALAFSDMASMIYNGRYTPTPADFTDAGIENPDSNRYQQALPFLLQSYHLSTDSTDRKVILGHLIYVVDESLDKRGDHHLALCRLYLLYKNDISKADRYFTRHPNQTRAIELLLNEVIERLNDPNTDVEKAQTLLNFSIEHEAEQAMPLTIAHIQLKIYLFEGEHQKALDYYRKHIPTTYPLTTSEYFDLGSAMLNYIALPGNNNRNEQLSDEAIELLYQAYSRAEKEDDQQLKSDTKNLIVKLLTDQQNKGLSANNSVCTDGTSEAGEQVFNNFIYRRRNKLSQETNIRNIDRLEGFRFAREAAVSSTFNVKLFGTREQHPELSFIDQIIADLEQGRSLSERMKDPDFTAQLAQYPLLNRFITEKLLDNTVNLQTQQQSENVVEQSEERRQNKAGEGTRAIRGNNR